MSKGSVLAQSEGTVLASEVRQFLNTAGVTEGHGSRGRIALGARVQFVVANPKRAREHAAAVGITLGSKKGRLSTTDAEKVAATIGG